MIDAVARQNNCGRDYAPGKNIHQYAVQIVGGNPTHVFTQKTASSLTEFSNLETFHAEGLYHAVACHPLLDHLVQFAKPILTLLHGLADKAPQLREREKHHWQNNQGSKRHPPFKDEQHRGVRNQTESLKEEI